MARSLRSSLWFSIAFGFWAMVESKHWAEAIVGTSAVLSFLMLFFLAFYFKEAQAWNKRVIKEAFRAYDREAQPRPKYYRPTFVGEPTWWPWKGRYPWAKIESIEFSNQGSGIES